MACACGKKRRPMIGTPRAAKSADTVTAAATSAATSGSWATTCPEDTGTYRSLLAAQRAAKVCGGRVTAA